MLLLLEIGLTIAAWRKGWKGWALLPAGIGMAVCFVMGMAIGASGGSDETMFAVGLVADFAMVIALIVMVVKKPRHIQEAKAVETVTVTAKSENV